MKSYILPLIILLSIASCQEEEETDLSGRYNFIEPPHPTSRHNRLDNSEVAFDVIFTIQGAQLTEVDLVVHGIQIADEAGGIEGRNITFEGGGGKLTVLSVRKSGNTLQATGAEFTMNGQTEIYGPLQIDPY